MLEKFKCFYSKEFTKRWEGVDNQLYARRFNMDRTIRVTGKGKISVKPDTIRINIKAEETYKEYSLSVKKSTEQTKLLREAMSKAGLDPHNLKTTHFSIDTDYESYRDENGDYQSRFAGYKYTHNLYIQFSNNNEQLGKVLYQLANNAANVEFSIRYIVKDVDAVKNELLDKAVEDSKVKAEVLAKATGVYLGEIETVDYSWGELEVYSEPFDGMILSNQMESKEAYKLEIEADDIDIQDTVTIVWKIK